MNKRTVLASLNKIANQLDIEGLHNEADTVTKVMSRLAMDEDDEYNVEDYFPYGDPDGDDDEYMDEDDDMGFESEPFDYNSPEDEGDMYGDDMKGYMDKDTDF